MSYVIELLNSTEPCWVNDDIEGDPGRTLKLANATRYPTEEDAESRVAEIEKEFPNRKYIVFPVEEYDSFSDTKE